jgi:hypothetical protein
MYYSVMQQVLCIDLAVEGVSRKLWFSLYSSCWRRGRVRRGRVYPHYTVSVMIVSYLNRIGPMAIVWNRMCTRVNRTAIVRHSGVSQVVDVGLGDGLEWFHTIYIRS